MEFSVVIPLFNKEGQIERAVGSVLSQSFPKFELIVVNDGSTDGSEYKVSQYRDQRLRLISQKNAGEAAARNKGISLAAAQHIAFLDADDAWKESFLSEIAALVEASPNLPLYGTAFEVKEETGETGRYWVSDIKNIIGDGHTLDYLKCLACGIYPVNSSCVCVRSDAFESVGQFDPNLKIGADIDMWIRLASLGSFGYTEKVLSTYHRDADCRSTKRKDFHERRLEFLEKQASLYLRWSGSTIDRRNLERYISREAYKELCRFHLTPCGEWREMRPLGFSQMLWQHITLWQKVKSVLKCSLQAVEKGPFTA